MNMTARILFAMGRDRGLPTFFGISHPRFKTPWVAIVFCLVLTVVLGVTLGKNIEMSVPGPDGNLFPLPQPVPFYIFIATTATLGILSAYLLVALSGLVFFQRSKMTKGSGVIWQVLLPVVAILICGAALFSSIDPLPPAPPLSPPLSYAPWVFLVWLVLGLILVVALRLVNPAQVRKFGQIVAGAGEEASGETAEGATSP
jgi:amino acid transporter